MQILNTGLVRVHVAASLVVAEYEVPVEVKVVTVLVVKVRKRRSLGWYFIKSTLRKTFGAGP